MVYLGEAGCVCWWNSLELPLKCCKLLCKNAFTIVKCLQSKTIEKTTKVLGNRFIRKSADGLF